MAKIRELNFGGVVIEIEVEELATTEACLLGNNGDLILFRLKAAVE